MARRPRARIGFRSSAAVAGAVLVLLCSPATPGRAQTDPDAEPVDEEMIQETLELYMNEFSNADLDGDGEADFADTNGDGFPDQVQEGFPGDLDLRPGDGRFGQEITAEFAASIPTAVSAGTGSTLLYDCGGMAASFDSNGDMVDWAIGIGSSEGGGPTGQLVDLYPEEDLYQRAFTRSNPFFVVDTVVYFGRMPGEGEGARNHVWYIRTAGISLDEGGDDNPDGNNRNAGEVSISDDVPGGSFLFPSGLFPIDGDLTSENGVRCAGSGWVEFDTGNPFLSAAGLAAMFLGLGGIMGLLFNSRPAITWRA